MLTVGTILAFITLVAFLIFFREGELEQARTAAFTVLVLGQMVVVFLVRGREKWNSNKLLLLAVALTVILQILILTVPALSSIFDVVTLR